MKQMNKMTKELREAVKEKKFNGKEWCRMLAINEDVGAGLTEPTTFEGFKEFLKEIKFNMEG